MRYNPYMNQGAFRAPVANLAVGYHPQFNPELAEQHQQEVLMDADRFEKGYQGSQQFLEKAGEVPIRANQDDMAWAAKHYENAKSNLYGIVKDKYNGDWGAAMPELGAKMAEEAGKWSQIQRASLEQKKLDDQTDALEKAGKLILPTDENGNRLDPRKRSIFDSKGRVAMSDTGIYERGDWEGWAEKNVSKSLNDSDRIGKVVSKYGYLIEPTTGGVNPAAWADLKRQDPALDQRLNEATYAFIDSNKEYAVDKLGMKDTNFDSRKLTPQQIDVAKKDLLAIVQNQVSYKQKNNWEMNWKEKQAAEDKKEASVDNPFAASTKAPLVQGVSIGTAKNTFAKKTAVGTKEAVALSGMEGAEASEYMDTLYGKGNYGYANLPTIQKSQATAIIESIPMNDYEKRVWDTYKMGGKDAVDKMPMVNAKMPVDVLDGIMMKADKLAQSIPEDAQHEFTVNILYDKPIQGKPSTNTYNSETLTNTLLGSNDLTKANLGLFKFFEVDKNGTPLPGADIENDLEKKKGNVRVVGTYDSKNTFYSITNDVDFARPYMVVINENGKNKYYAMSSPANTYAANDPTEEFTKLKSVNYSRAYSFPGLHYKLKDTDGKEYGDTDISYTDGNWIFEDKNNPQNTVITPDYDNGFGLFFDNYVNARRK